MKKDKGFWIGLSLLNLSIIAILGLLMRSKILFSIPFLDYRKLLNAHSFFALTGWLGLALLTWLIYEILPPHLSQKKVYTFLLWAFQISAAGMGFSFLCWGYHTVSVFFLLLYVAASFVFGLIYFIDIKRAKLLPMVRWLSLGAVVSLLLAAVLPPGLAYMMLSRSGGSLLYRDLAYTFLHLQYNGFFTLAVFALFFAWYQQKKKVLPPAASPFAVCLLLSVLPSAFLSLLWHNHLAFYVLAAVGSLLILASLYFFVLLTGRGLRGNFFPHPFSRVLWIAAFFSFVLKMVLLTATLLPALGNAVYGARPVIIGFMHLVFLAFVSFFILGLCIEQGYFSREKGWMQFPFYLFGTGVVLTEFLLLLQGLTVLFQTSLPFYAAGLWVGAVLLLAGAVLLTVAFYRSQGENESSF